MTSQLLASAGLPDGVALMDAIYVLVPIFIVTVALRALPFAALAKLRQSAVVAWLGLAMPVGVMTVLIVYSFHETGEQPGGYVGVALALAATIALHVWRRSATLSILLGTAFYVILVNFLF